MNPNGGGISLGHPLGATGARITATLVSELERRDARYGIARDVHRLRPGHRRRRRADLRLLPRGHLSGSHGRGQAPIRETYDFVTSRVPSDARARLNAGCRRAAYDFRDRFRDEVVSGPGPGRVRNAGSLGSPAMGAKELRNAHIAVAVAFVAFGAVDGTWVARLPAIKDRLGLDSGELGLVILAVSLVATLLLTSAGWLASRRGSRGADPARAARRRGGAHGDGVRAVVRIAPACGVRARRGVEHRRRRRERARRRDRASPRPSRPLGAARRVELRPARRLRHRGRRRGGRHRRSRAVPGRRDRRRRRGVPADAEAAAERRGRRRRDGALRAGRAARSRCRRSSPSARCSSSRRR